MIRKFIAALKSRIEEDRGAVVETLSRTRNASPERREAQVERNNTLLDVLRWIDELYKADEDDLADDELVDPTVPVTPAPRKPARRQSPARPWGGE